MLPPEIEPAQAYDLQCERFWVADIVFVNFGDAIHRLHPNLLSGLHSADRQPVYAGVVTKSPHNRAAEFIVRIGANGVQKQLDHLISAGVELLHNEYDEHAWTMPVIIEALATDLGDYNFRLSKGERTRQLDITQYAVALDSELRLGLTQGPEEF